MSGNKKSCDQVVLRRWRGKHRGVIALFPDDVWSAQGLVNSYEHVGQHGGADYTGVVAATDPVRPNDPDAKELLRELRQIGYNPCVRMRRTRVR
jgi:hypothetical protein